YTHPLRRLERPRELRPSGRKACRGRGSRRSPSRCTGPGRRSTSPSRSDGESDIVQLLRTIVRKSMSIEPPPEALSPRRAAPLNPARKARKGERTRAAVVDAALELAARDGLDGLTIGALAARMQMSKSGVFAHFGSREDLQIAVLKTYEHRFVEDVLLP